MHMAFRLLDVDGSGKVSRKELRELLESNYTFNAEEEYKMNPKELDDMISSCDKNGDGEIDYDEFIKMMTLTGK
jgi:calcium-dependent protein kinase